MLDTSINRHLKILDLRLTRLGGKSSKGLDNQGRILVPAKLRREFYERQKHLEDNSLYYCFGERRDYRFIQVRDYISIGRVEADFCKGEFIDKFGRIKVSEQFRCVLNGPVEFLPMNGYFEIWDESDLKNYISGIPSSHTQNALDRVIIVI